MTHGPRLKPIYDRFGALEGRARCDPRAVQAAGRIPGRGRGRSQGRGVARARRLRRPHRNALRHARPDQRDRPRPGVRDRDQRRRPAAPLCHRRHRRLRRARRRDRPRGVAARGHRLSPRRQGQPLSAVAERRRGEPASRRPAPGDPVHGPGRPGRAPRSSNRSSGRSSAAAPSSAMPAVSESRPLARLLRARAAGRRRPRRRAAPPASIRRSRRSSRFPAGGYGLDFRPMSAIEQANAALSLAANLAVADALLAARTGLFRIMDEPGQRAVSRLRHTAKALGVDWPTNHVARAARADASIPTTARTPPSCSPSAAPARARAMRRSRRARARGIRRWPRPMSMPPRRCGASPTATSPRPRSPSPTASPFPTGSPPLSRSCPTS